MPLHTIFQRQPKANDPFGDLDLGDIAEDTMTGFRGVVIATNRNISGCDQVCLQPPTQDGKWEEGRWFDIERIQRIEAAAVKFTERRTGADVTPPSRSARA